MSEKQKKKLVKRWWFWAIIVIIVLIFIGAGSSSGSKSNQSNDTSKTSSNNTNTTATKTKKETRDNSTAKKTTLSAGTFTVGKEIPAGRYVVKSEKDSGNFVVNQNQMPVVNAILDPTGENGVKTVTCNLKDGEKINISGMNTVVFTPAVTKLSDTLTDGTWTVGLDIAPGRYVVRSEKDSGNFIVNQDGMPVVNEILDPTGQNGVKTVTCNLQNGETIDISSINEVKFTKQ